MYRSDTVTAAATAIAAHATALGLPSPTTGHEGMRALLDSLDARMESLGRDLEAEARLAHLERGRGLYLVTVSNHPTAHDGPGGPETYDLEVEAFSLRQALELSLDGLRTRQWVSPREAGRGGTDGFVPADPERYAGTASIRQGTWDDVAPAIARDIAARRAKPLPAAAPLPAVSTGCDGEMATAALLAHGAAFNLDDAASTSPAGTRRMLASLFDYAEACGHLVGSELGEARAAREAVPTHAFG